MGTVRAILARLPRGDDLPEEVWQRRHKLLLLLLVAHVGLLIAFGVVRGYAAAHVALENALPAAMAVIGWYPKASRRLRMLAVAFGLLTCSALLVHFSGGLIEMHFHFFVIVPLLTLYHGWEPFLLAIAYVAFHHGVIGIADPTSVFNHAAAVRKPWLWALIHAGFVLAASAFSLVAWRLQEDAYRREREARERLRALIRMKDTFLLALSHELRTPMAAIVGFAITLEERRDELKEEQVDQIVHGLARNAGRLRELVDDILDVDRLTRGDVDPDLDTVDMGSLARTVVDDLPDEEGVRVAIDPGFVEARVDPMMMRRVVANLVGNALKYSPEETKVTVRVVPDGADVLLIVEDRGPGVPDEHKVSIFEPFERGPSMTWHAPGSGIGLSLVARFAELHGGTAWVEDRRGGGSSFRVRIPESLAHPAAAS